MVRIAYLGTDGCPGHHVIPIRGKFTEEDIKVIESIDCDDFYKVFDVMRLYPRIPFALAMGVCQTGNCII